MTRNDEKRGIIYILKHETGTTVKVGKTTVSGKSRHAAYTRAYDLKKFKLHKEFQVPFSEVSDIEKCAHRALSKYQLSGLDGAREIFSCGANVAERAILKAISENEEVKRQEAAEKERRERAKLLQQALEREWMSSEDYAEYKSLLEKAKTIESGTAQVDSMEAKKGPLTVAGILIICLAFLHASIPPILWPLILGFTAYFTFSAIQKKHSELIEAEVNRLRNLIASMRRDAETLRSDFASRFYFKNRP